MSSRRGCWTT